MVKRIKLIPMVAKVGKKRMPLQKTKTQQKKIHMISRDSKGLFNLDPLADFYTTNEIKKFYNKTNRQ